MEISPAAKTTTLRYRLHPPATTTTIAKIYLTEVEGIVAWKNDTDPKEQHTSDLYINLHVDTTKLLAMFTMHGFICFDGKPKTSLYLLVHPEWIQSIEYNPSGNIFISM